MSEYLLVGALIVIAVALVAVLIQPTKPPTSE